MLNLLSRLMLTIPEEDVMYGYYDPMPVDEAQILGIVVLVWLGLLLFSLANYILFSLGLYNVAKNNNVSAPGLAWVPVARQWVKGSIVDFHSHIIPSANHGSSSVETTISQLKLAQKSSVTRIIATPHFYPSHENVDTFIE